MGIIHTFIAIKCKKAEKKQCIQSCHARVNQTRFYEVIGEEEEKKKWTITKCSTREKKKKKKKRMIESQC